MAGKELRCFHGAGAPLPNQLEKNILIGTQAIKELDPEEHRFLFQLFNESPIGLNLCRMHDGMWLASNPAFLEIIGYTAEEANGCLTYWQLTPPKYDDQEALQLKKLNEMGNYGPYEKEFVHKSGHLVAVRLSGFVTEVQGVKYIWS